MGAEIDWASDRPRLEQRLELAGAPASDAQIDQLLAYLGLLERWNRRMNLTALDDPDEAMDRLLVEPTLAAAEIDPAARSLIDIGSGGGSPAIPLKIARPDLSLTMVEVKTRKSVFLREGVRHLGLASCRVVTSRFEQALDDPLVRGQVDVISIRAVRAEKAQLELFRDALRPGGQQLWFLGRDQPLPAIPAGLTLARDRPLLGSHALGETHVSPLQSRLVVLTAT